MKKILLFTFVLSIFFLFPSPKANAIDLSIGSKTACVVGDSFNIAVNTTAITNSGTFSLRVKYDPAVLELVSVLNWAPGYSQIVYFANNTLGQMSASWVLTTGPVSIPAGKFFDLRFRYLGGNSQVYFSSVLGENEITDDEANAFPLTLFNGNVFDGRPLLAINPSTSGSICNGDSLKINATKNSTFTYTWYQDNVIIPGLTSDSIYAKTAGFYKVKAQSVCGDSTTNPFQLTVISIPNQPGIISGQNSVCQDVTGIAYSIVPVSGAISYSWNIPPSWTLNSGGGTNSITIDFPITALTGNLTVQAVNTCGSSAASNPVSISVNAAAPSAPGLIGGSPTVCQGDTAVTFSIFAVANATSYLWTTPSGVYLRGLGNTNSVIADFAGNSTSGNMSVIAQNGCGSSSSSPIFAVNINNTPTAIVTASTSQFCIGDSVILHTNTGTGNTYTWYNSGNLISGASDSILKVFAGGIYTSKVITSSNCSDLSNDLTLTQLSLPTVDFTGLATEYCVDAVATTLTGSPVGGSFSGLGITANSFNPTSASAGGHSITYTYTDANLCTNSISKSVTVYALPTVTLSSLSDVCINTSTFVLSGGNPSGGNYSGMGVTSGSFNPAVAGAGSIAITYSYTDVHNCQNTDSKNIQVNALPVLSVTGLDSIYCINSTSSTLNPTPSGGTFSGTGITGSIFNPITAGVGIYTINYAYTDIHNCSNSLDLFTRVDSIPFANAGIDKTINLGGAGTIIGTLCNPEFTYLWTPSTGLSSATNCTPLANPIVATEYILTVYNHACSNKDTVNIALNSTFNISGTLTYDNAAHSAMQNVKLYLTENSIIVDSTITNASGNYVFDYILNGNYVILPSITKAFGGINSTDALLVQRHFAGLTTLLDMKLKAGDVSGNIFINSADALLIKRRYANLIFSFTTGDWMYDSLSVTVLGADTVRNIRTICYGDVNGSYTPAAAKIGNSVELIQNNSIQIQNNKTFKVPVMFEDMYNLGAISLKLSNLSQNLTIKNLEFTDKFKDAMVYKIEGNQIHIAWHNIDAVQVTKNDILFYIEFTNSNPENLDVNLEISKLSECADETAEVISLVQISYPKLSLKNISSIETTVVSQPNPFTSKTNIIINTSVDAIGSLKITNLLGEVVYEEKDIQLKAGENMHKLDLSELNVGVYFLTTYIKSNTKEEKVSYKMIKN